MFSLKDIIDNSTTLLLCLVSFCLPWGVAFYNISVAFCLLYLGYIFFRNKQFSFDRGNRNIYYYVPFLIFILISLIYSENIPQGLTNALHYSHFILWGVIILILNVKVDIKLILATFICSVILYGLYVNISTLIHILYQKEPILLLITHYNRNFLTQVVPNAMQPMYFSVYIVTAWLFLFYIFNRKDFLSKFIFLIITLYFCFLLYILSSKIIVIFILIFTFLQVSMFLLKSIAFYKRFLISSFIFLVIISCLYFFKTEIINLILGDEKVIYWHQDFVGRLLYFIKHGDASRTDNWSAAIEVIKNNLFFGVGVGDVFDVLQVYRDKSSWAYIENANTHNQFLSVAIASGIIGFLAFLYFVISLIIKAIRLNCFLLLYFTILFILFMFVENVFDRHQGVVLFGFFTFLLMNFEKSSPKIE